MAATVTHTVAAPLQVEQVAPGVYVHIGQHKDVEDGYDGDIANIGFGFVADRPGVLQAVIRDNAGAIFRQSLDIGG